MPDSHGDPGDDAVDARLPEARDVRLIELLRSDSSSAFATAMRRVVREVEQTGQNYAAFGNAP